MNTKSSERILTLDRFGLTVELVGDDDALKVAPSSRITPEARAFILTHKEELRERLLGPVTFAAAGDITAAIVTDLVMTQATTARHATDSDDREVIEERVAIMEYDGGLSRDEAEHRASVANECTGCMFWKGAQSVATGRYTALSAAGVDAKPKSHTIGMCARYNKPWRVSNIASDPDYQRWHFIGQCGRKAT